MRTDWKREFEHQLVDDPRFEAGKSRFSSDPAFFYEGKELAHFHTGGIDIRLTAAGIYALQSKLARDCVLSVAKDWVLLRLESEEDNEFAMAVLERAVREAHSFLPRPVGKKTRRVSASSNKSQALSGFSAARALKSLEELDPGEALSVDNRSGSSNSSNAKKGRKSLKPLKKGNLPKVDRKPKS